MRLTPVVGYQAAGFALHAFGYGSSPAIGVLAEFGLLPLLFGIWLKLNLRHPHQAGNAGRDESG